jgi:hypothetical protein
MTIYSRIRSKLYREAKGLYRDARYDPADKTIRERFTVNPFISPVNQLYATINRSYDQ